MGEGTGIEQVVLGGREPQYVVGLPSGVNVVEAYLHGSSSYYFPSNRIINTPKFRNAARDLYEITGLDLSSFQGSYRPSGPFTVDQVQDDPRLLSGYPFGTPVSELPYMHWSGVHRVSGDRPHDDYATYGDFTLAGPVESTHVRLPRNFTYVEVDAEGQYYGTENHRIFEFDPVLQTAEEMDLSSLDPRLSWACGMAYDSYRDRLIISTFGGEGMLYSYSPTANSWSTIASLNNLDLSGITYDETSDTIFACYQRHGEGIMPELIQYSAEGVLMRRITLSDPMLPGILRWQNAPQLTAIDGQIVIRTEPDIDPFERTYIVDPLSGAVTLAVVPEPSTFLLLAIAAGSCTIGLVRRRRHFQTGRPATAAAKQLADPRG